MAKVIVTAEVQDGAKWREGFRTHGDLFKEQTVTSIHYGVTDDNVVSIIAEVDDLDTYFRILESPATAEAMEFDGVKRDTVKVVVLDSVLIPN